MRLKNSLELRRDELAKEFCKDWPAAVYHPNDLTTFYERGFDAAMAIKDERVQRLLEVLKLIDIGQRDKISAPYDAAIKELCERIGYGAVMDSAARQWRKIDPNGALTSGPCVVTIKNALAEYQAEPKTPTPDPNQLTLWNMEKN